MAVTKEYLSESTTGLGIKVAATATPGTAIHTAHATAKDEIRLLAVNNSASNLLLTLEWGGVTSPDNTIPYTVPAKDSLKITAPYMLLGDSLVVRAFAAIADQIVIYGDVNRIA